MAGAMRRCEGLAAVAGRGGLWCRWRGCAALAACGCDESDELHADEFDGPADYAGDQGEWNAIARTVQDRSGGVAMVELAVLGTDGSEAVLRLTPDQA